MNPACPWCPDGLMEPIGLLDDRASRCTSCGRLHLEGAVPVDYVIGPATWWGGANCDEVLGFRLSGANPPDGSGVPGLDDQELRRQVALVGHRLDDRRTRTRWLEGYARALVREARARNAASEGVA